MTVCGELQAASYRRKQSPDAAAARPLEAAAGWSDAWNDGAARALNRGRVD